MDLIKFILTDDITAGLALIFIAVAVATTLLLIGLYQKHRTDKNAADLRRARSIQEILKITNRSR